MVREYEERLEKQKKEENSDNQSEESDNSLHIYKKAYACFRPEPGESNAESVEQQGLIEARVAELKRKRRKDKTTRSPSRIEAHFNTSTQLKRTIDNKQRRVTVRRKRLHKDSKTITKTTTTIMSRQSMQYREDKDDRQRNPKQAIYTTNTQQYTFEEDTAFLTDQRITTHQMKVIMDTGATFTMLPGEFEFAWTLKRPCVHTIEGCFKGGKTNEDKQIGEMHALITLDIGEMRRAIIPQAVVIPLGMTNSYLLAATPFLIVDHRYTCKLVQQTSFQRRRNIYNRCKQRSPHHRHDPHRCPYTNTTQRNPVSPQRTT
jgi:hypothetical protein